jgi:VWFA-related protein
MLRHSLMISLACLAAASGAGQDAPTIRVTTRMVEVHVLVQDKHGRPVAGLTKADFVLKDRGKPEKITAFAVESNRPSAEPPASLPPGVFSNRISRAWTSAPPR